MHAIFLHIKTRAIKLSAQIKPAQKPYTLQKQPTKVLRTTPVLNSILTARGKKILSIFRYLDTCK